ncbi:trypsin domain-containing protein [Ditylenchus destructor]|uniref:Trypsin domain-containing protein n=1 Tax=Ditylenchus destructor TaxID=166010 RepID=A0AAD4MSQ5_9BILA|nr:trypsin domain-containing protein [Ditylenchus destructor]
MGKRFLSLCLFLVAISTAFSAPLVDEDECGISDFSSYHVGERVLNGTPVPQGKYPWLAFLSLGPAFCSATIVSKRFILTASHCLCEDIETPGAGCSPTDPQEMTVVVGSVNNREGQSFKVKRAIPHENYTVIPLPHHDTGATYDVGLIELEKPLTFGKDVRRICLSGKHQDGDPDKNVVIAGWGLLSQSGYLPDVLHEGTVRVVDDAACKKIDAKYDSGTMICLATHNNTETYSGDSGGPAMINVDGRWSEIGTTSYGYIPLDLKNPSVDARVSHFCEWIANKTENEVQCDA